MRDDDPILLLTRPAAQSARFAARCASLLGPGAQIVQSPLQEIRPRPDLPGLPPGAAAVFTSANGVSAAPQPGAGRRAYCVGDRTAEAARAAGYEARSAAGDAEALIAAILQDLDRPDGPLVHIRGAEARGDVAPRLRAGGLTASELIAYDQRARPLSAEAAALMRGAAPIVAPIFSPRSAELLSKAARGAAAPLLLVALSQAVADAWTGPEPQRWALAARPDAAHMLDQIATIWTHPSA